MFWEDLMHWTCRNFPRELRLTYVSRMRREGQEEKSYGFSMWVCTFLCLTHMCGMFLSHFEHSGKCYEFHSYIWAFLLKKKNKKNKTLNYWGTFISAFTVSEFSAQLLVWLYFFSANWNLGESLQDRELCMVLFYNSIFQSVKHVRQLCECIL